MDVKDWIETGVIIGTALAVIIKQFVKRKEPGFLKTMLVVDDPIYKLLNDFLFEPGAVRAFIFQFHNGSKYYSGQHIQRMTMSHERHRPGLKPIKPYHDNILVGSEIHDIFQDMRRERRHFYYCEDREQIKDAKPDLYMWMRTHHLVGILYVQLLDSRNAEPIGVLALGFNYRGAINESHIDLVLPEKAIIEAIFRRV